MKIYWCP